MESTYYDDDDVTTAHRESFHAPVSTKGGGSSEKIVEELYGPDRELPSQ